MSFDEAFFELNNGTAKKISRSVTLTFSFITKENGHLYENFYNKKKIAFIPSKEDAYQNDWIVLRNGAWSKCPKKKN